MTDFKWFGQCFRCKLNRFFIRKREIQLPIGKTAKSREMFCTPCHKIIKASIDKGVTN